MMRRLPGIAHVLFLVLCAVPVSAAGETVVDLTAGNRAALSRNVERLQHVELLRISRGRMKPSPILYPFHTIYQMVLSDPEFILDRLTSVYGNTLARLEKTAAQYPDVVLSPAGRALDSEFRKETAALYSLDKKLDSHETILEIWREMENSRLGMEILPVRAAFAMNARRWAETYYRDGGIPPRVEGALADLARRAPDCSDIFCSEKFLRDLSGDYSQLFLSIATGAPGEELPGGGR